ncbi:MAG: magnesium transporter [Firmicutes bacterium ML8_F2]|nr:MAG: magnesium transporter [Firmicutes bacterium ML8_F2]
MFKKAIGQSYKAGLPPGSLVHVGELKSNTSEVTVCGYGKDFYRENKTSEPEECLSLLEEEAIVVWVNLDGLADIEMLQRIGNFFNLHRLTLEDILNNEQRPRQEAYENYTYIVLKALVYNDDYNRIDTEQVSIVIGSNYVFSVCERKTELFDTLRKRLASDKSSIRKKGADYLAYAIMDMVVDGYFPVLEKVSDHLENLEELLLEKPEEKILHALHRLKREMLGMRQAVWPLREALIGLEKSDSIFIQTDNAFHLRDVYSHTVQIIETAEIYREILSGLFEIYLSSVNNRLNEVMKILTIFAAIFIPLTLISGIYGMNFAYMPELNWRYGYPFSLGLMAVVVVFMLLYFRRKRWF